MMIAAKFDVSPLLENVVSSLDKLNEATNELNRLLKELVVGIAHAGQSDTMDDRKQK